MHYLSKRLAVVSSLVACLVVPGGVFGALVVFDVGGDTTTQSIQETVDDFREALGNPDNGNAPGPLASGRREINWDGGGSTATTPPVTPFNVFLNTRGGQFTTPGVGLTQAPPSGGPQDGLEGLFNNPNLGDTFGVFSSPRLFTPVLSNITEGSFFIPGTNGAVPATVSGFGAVFTDVDLNGSTRIQFFDADDNELLNSIVPPGTVDSRSLSFLGVMGDAGEQIARVRITTGNTAIGSNFLNPNVETPDVVAMDDFIYGEPVPEPGVVGLAAAGLILLLWRRRRCPKGLSPIEG